MIGKNQRELCKQTFGHFCTDATCAAVVVSGTSDFTEVFIFFALYNFLAFCLQPLAGWVLDKFKCIRFEYYILAAFVFLLVGFIPNLNIWGRVVTVGIGNCLFHTGAGALIMTLSADKMMPLGVFVSSGAVGLTLGTIFAENSLFREFLGICLMLLAVWNIRLPDKQLSFSERKQQRKVAILLCLCVALRAYMGFAPITQFEMTPEVVLMITGCVFLGKSLGGILCDRWGIGKVILISTILVLLLFLPAVGNPYLWGAVQLIVNLSMPITLYLLYRCMPTYPAFSFGLAASFLAVGLVPVLLHIVLPMSCFLLLFLINSIIIFYAERKIK